MHLPVTRLSVGIAASLMAMALAPAVLAQDLPAGQVATGEDPDRAPRVADTLDSVIVTGSRIARPELESTMPIGVIDMDRSRAFGKTTAYEAIQRDPAVGPGTGPYNYAPEGTYDGGMATIELRNMGDSRSLTLIDGRRRVSGSARSSAVDLNMIPSGMIERIEIITGGAAAVYGADAVTGAANVITRRSFDGLQFSGTKGMTQEGDGARNQFSVVAGTMFADGRGSVTIGGTWVKNDEIYVEDRWWAKPHLSYQANPDNTSANDGIPDRIISYNGGSFYLNPYPTMYVGGNHYILNQDGSADLGRYDTQFSTGELSFGAGGTHPYHLSATDYLVAPVENASIIGRLDYDINEHVTYGLRFDYGRSRFKGHRRAYREDSRSIWLNGAGGAVAYLDNPFLPDSFRQIMLDNGLDRANVSRTYRNFGLTGDLNDRQTATLAHSLEGNLANGFKWEAFWQYGRATNNIQAPDTPRASRIIAARDVIADPLTGQPVCRDEAARAAGCVPLDIFSVDPLSDAQRAYMMGTRRKSRENTQLVYGGNLTGGLFSLPAGEVQSVLGFEYRRETVSNVDDAAAETRELSHQAAWAPYEPPLDAEYDVSELYAELVVPVLKDLPFAHKLTMEGAYRYSDYSTFGSTDTWKLGANWMPFEGLTVRAVRSKSVRVPNFGELYAQVSTAGFNPTDPCEVGQVDQSPTRIANCAALGIATPLQNRVDTAISTSGGNPGLTPEVSSSSTFGVVWQPAAIRGLDLTVDYWQIELENIITNLSVGNVMNLCVDLPSIDNQFCGRVTRDADGYVTAVDSRTINASINQARGIDVGANYRFGLGNGNLHLGLRGSYLLEYELTTLPGVESSKVRYHGGHGNPRFKGTLFASYDIGDWNFGLDTLYRASAMYDANVRTDEQYETNHVPSRVYNDVTVGWYMSESTTLRAGVNNVFNVSPPRLPSVYRSGGSYDVYGRYFFVNATVNF